MSDIPTRDMHATIDRLSVEEMRAMLHDQVNVLWPDEDPDEEWKAETIEWVAGVLTDHLLKPAPGEPTFADEVPDGPAST